MSNGTQTKVLSTGNAEDREETSKITSTHDMKIYNNFQVVNKLLVKELGYNKAVLFAEIVYFIGVNKSKRQNYVDGRYWTYDTVESIADRHFELTKKQVEKALYSLRDEGLIIKDNFNKISFDHTSWYTATDKGIELYNKAYTSMPCSSVGIEEYELPKRGKQNSPRGENNTSILPVINTDNIEESNIRDKSLILSSSSPAPIEDDRLREQKDDEQVFIEFPVIGNKSVAIPESWCNEMQELYGSSVNIRDEIRLAKAWCMNNQKKKDWKKFLNNWFSRSLQRGGSANKYEAPQEQAEEEKKDEPQFTEVELILARQFGHEPRKMGR